MFKILNKSLTFKISLFITFLVMISVLLFSVIFISSEKTRISSEIVKNGIIFSNYSSNIIYNNFVQFYTHPKTEDFTNFKTNINSILSNNPDIVYVSLLGVNGKILFDTDEFANGKYTGDGRFVSDDNILNILKTGKNNSRNIIYNNSEVTEIIVPLSQAGGNTFFLRYIISNVTLANRLSEIYNMVFSVAFVLLFIVIFFSFIFTIYLIKPIKKLKDVIIKIKLGNFDIKVDTKSKDEIGDLASAFNDLTSKLKDSYSLLEVKVNDRTKELNEKVEQLAENNAELGDSKKAITNLLDDIENEKSKVEETVKIRTKELSEEKSRLLASINSLSFGFVIADIEDNIILTNPYLLNLIDINVAPNTVTDLAKYFSNFDLINSCKECIKAQKTIEIKEVTFERKYLKIFCAPIMNQDIVIGQVIIFEDITEAKVMERSKDEFFAVASHELRTPLTAIHGNTDMILTSYLDKIQNKDVKEMLVDIDNASVRLINIVNDFLKVSSLEQGKIVTKKEEFNISDIIKKIVKNLKGISDKKDIKLSYSSHNKELPNVFADKSQTEEVLVNLIGNAIKFTDKGEIDIKTEVEGKFVVIKVVDTGIGIEEKNQSLLFRKFQQAGKNILARNDTNSTGLGLYISKLLVLSMGGNISLEKSEPGVGSTFVFTLPVKS